MHHPTDRIAHTMAFVTPVVEHWLEREIAQWVNPMKDQSDDPSHHERTLLPQSYISLPKIKKRAIVQYYFFGAGVSLNIHSFMFSIASQFAIQISVIATRSSLVATR